MLLAWLAAALAVLEWRDLVAQPNRVPVGGAAPVARAAIAVVVATAAVLVMSRGVGRDDPSYSAEPARYSDHGTFQSP